MAGSVHDKLKKVRPPRVHITYDLETGGAIQKKEIPFVMGVLADLTGHPAEELKPLQERPFTELTPDNFDEVLAGMKPHLMLSVENRLTDDPEAGKLGVELNFQELDDFNPDRVAEQVPALRKLLELRRELANLRSGLMVNPKLEDVLHSTLGDEEKMKQARAEIDAETEGEEGEGSDE